jgi:hypothetical protein
VRRIKGRRKEEEEEEEEKKTKEEQINKSEVLLNS